MNFSADVADVDDVLDLVRALLNEQDSAHCTQNFNRSRWNPHGNTRSL